MDKDLTRAEFLKKNSPLQAKDEEDSINPPPLFKAEENTILGDTREIKESHVSEMKPRKDWRFWNDWSEKNYTYASVGLALMLVVYVGVSVASLSGGDDVSLNATLNVDQTSETEETEDQTDEMIEEDVVDSTTVIEDIEKDPSVEESSSDITEYIFENYEF